MTASLAKGKTSIKNAAAEPKVTISFLSGITLWTAPLKEPTPVISISRFFTLFTLAPIWFKKEISSSTSGSAAAFLMLVLPFAKEAVIIKASVPVCEFFGN
jgi:hypothetical protein